MDSNMIMGDLGKINTAITLFNTAASTIYSTHRNSTAAEAGRSVRVGRYGSSGGMPPYRRLVGRYCTYCLLWGVLLSGLLSGAD